MLDPATGENEPPRVWVRYSTGVEAPLEPYQGTGPLSSQGCALSATLHALAHHHRASALAHTNG